MGPLLLLLQLIRLVVQWVLKKLVTTFHRTKGILPGWKHVPLYPLRLRCRLGSPLREDVELEEEVAKATSFFEVISTIARGNLPNKPRYMCGG